MDFSFSDEDTKFHQEVLEFIKKELPQDWTGTGLLQEAKDGEEWEFARNMLRKLGDKGWHSLSWPKEFGGQDSVTKQFILSDEMYYHELPGVDLQGALMCAPTLIQYGSEQQRNEFLPKIARGEQVWCQGFSEPGAGSDLASVTTRAVDKGDHFIVDGQKVWSTGAHRADWTFILARTDPEAPKHKGISFLIVDLKSPGVTVRFLPNIVGTYCEIFFDNLVVPKENLIGKQNDGWRVTGAVLGYERSGIHRIAAARRNLARLIEFAKETKRNGKPLFADPVIRNRLAQLYVEGETAKILAHRIVWMQSSGKAVDYQASMSRVFGAEFQQRVAQAGLQITGAFGQLDEGCKWAPLSGFFQRQYLYAAAATVGAGTAEIQRNIIALRGLGLPRG
jgi:alkylation response protein AidB-like acyl-CoA dehydrogenase